MLERRSETSAVKHGLYEHFFSLALARYDLCPPRAGPDPVSGSAASSGSVMKRIPEAPVSTTRSNRHAAARDLCRIRHVAEKV